jgi:hypothetical protein
MYIFCYFLNIKIVGYLLRLADRRSAIPCTSIRFHQHGWGLHLQRELVPRLCNASIPMRLDAERSILEGTSSCHSPFLARLVAGFFLV